MKLVIQRVKHATVTARGEQTGSIDNGLFVLVGIGEDDTETNVEQLAEKLVKLRIMDDGNGKMNLSVQDVDGGILLVSQFTLYADTSAGNRPSFIHAASAEKAEKLYDHFVNHVTKIHNGPVESGIFGAYMEIDSVADGPVTIILEA